MWPTTNDKTDESVTCVTKYIYKNVCFSKFISISIKKTQKKTNEQLLEATHWNV